MGNFKTMHGTYQLAIAWLCIIRLGVNSFIFIANNPTLLINYQEEYISSNKLNENTGTPNIYNKTKRYIRDRQSIALAPPTIRNKPFAMCLAISPCAFRRGTRQRLNLPWALRNTCDKSKTHGKSKKNRAAK